MRSPPLAKLALVLIVFGASSGCVVLKKIPIPIPGRRGGGVITKEETKRLKIKSEITKKMKKLRQDIEELKGSQGDMRAEGFDTTKSEELLQKAEGLLKQAENSYIDAEDYEQYLAVMNIVGLARTTLAMASEEMKKSPRFKDHRPRRQIKEFGDDRDVIFEKLGHPDPRNVHVGPSTSFRFSISSSSSILDEAITLGCYDPRFNQFILQFPPKIMVIEYNTGVEGPIQVVLAEKNSTIDRFTSKQSLSDQERDMALIEMCRSQGTGWESYQLLAVYKGGRVGTPEDYLRQLLSGEFRFVDQFGIGIISDRAKALAPLGDLELASIVFNTAVAGVNAEQNDLLKKIKEKVDGAKLQREATRYESKTQVLVFDPTRADEISKAFGKVALWQATLSPKKRDKEELLKSIGDDEELKKLLNSFEEKIKNLVTELIQIRNQLVKFKKDYGRELLFYDDENPVIVLLLKNVGFQVEPHTARTLVKAELPQLTVGAKFFYFRSKYDDEPVFVREGSFKITEANKYIDISKEYQRFTSFIIGWPSSKSLAKGNYKLQLEIVDEVRQKSLTHEIKFTVLPAELRQQLQ